MVRLPGAGWRRSSVVGLLAMVVVAGACGSGGDGSGGPTTTASPDDGSTSASTVGTEAVSGALPEPRTFAAASDDLHRLLDAAGFEGPFVLVGSSAGGGIVLDFARRYPDSVAGVLSMNPVPLASQWAARAYPLLTADEVADEKALAVREDGRVVHHPGRRARLGLARSSLRGGGQPTRHPPS